MFFGTIGDGIIFRSPNDCEYMDLSPSDLKLTADNSVWYFNEEGGSIYKLKGTTSTTVEQLKISVNLSPNPASTHLQVSTIDFQFTDYCLQYARVKSLDRKAASKQTMHHTF